MDKAQKKEIVRRIKAGESRRRIAADTGFSKGYLRIIWRNYQLLGNTSFEPGTRGPTNRTPGKRKPPTSAQKKKIRLFVEQQEQALDAGSLRKLIQSELKILVSRKILIELLNQWQIPLFSNPPGSPLKELPLPFVRKIATKEKSLQKKLQRAQLKSKKNHWDILGLSKGNRRDGPGPQWRKRHFHRDQQSHFYLELWTNKPDTALTLQSRQLLKRKIHAFSKHLGIDVLSYVIMDSHCFLLLRLPPKTKRLKKIADPEALLEKARVLYQPAQFRRLEKQLAEISDPKRILAHFQEEFCDLSVFVKRLKETITRNQNLEQNTTGSLWRERYRSLEVTSPDQLRDCHFRINRWPLTLKVVDPHELSSYPWFSYHDLVASSKRAIKGTCHALGVPVSQWRKPYPRDQKKGRKRTTRNWFIAQIENPPEQPDPLGI
jgi:REP element-mobilizing transposase RayT